MAGGEGTVQADTKRAADTRFYLRRAYRCECSGPLPVESVEPGIAGAVLEGIEDWTGEPQRGCPWSALSDPFVKRVLEAYPAFEHGEFALAHPDPSYRLARGVLYYHSVANRVDARATEAERRNREAERGRA